MGDYKIDIRDDAVELGEQIIESLKISSARSLKRHRELDKQFEKRNVIRWQDGFDHLLTMISISSEFIETTIKEIRLGSESDLSPKLFALQALHARGVRISRECYCLMTSGFADAALARWRTLFELAVISNILSEADESISQRYIDSLIVKNSKELVKYAAAQHAANLKPLSDDEVDQGKRAAEIILRKHGQELKEDYGWASPLVKTKNRLNNPKPNLSHLMELGGFTSWGPRYSWANRELHGGFLPPDFGLGVSEANDQLYLIGSSNSGMIDPGQHVAYHLYAVSLPVLRYMPSTTSEAYIYVLNYYKHKVEKSFIAATR